MNQSSTPTETARPQHTPGPWEVGARRRDGSFNGRDFFTIPILASLGPLSRACAPAVAQGPEGEVDANARLIAAAPALAEALRTIQHARDYCGEHGIYPPEVSLGDASDRYQCFDDWAADVAKNALALLNP